MKNKKTIVVNANQGIRDLEPYILKELKKKFYTIFIVNIKQDIEFYKKKYSDCFDEIIPFVYDYNFVKIKNFTYDYKKKVRDYEKLLNIPIYKLFFTDRTIGRGFFASGGHNHPLTKAQFYFSHEDCIKLAAEYITFWENVLSNKNIKFAMNLPPYAHLIAKKRNIFSKRIVGGKFKNTKYWASDLFMQPENLKLTKISKNKKSLKKIQLNSPYAAHILNRKLHIINFSFFYTLKNSLKFLLQHFYGKLKGNIKSKNLFLKSTFLVFWKRRSDFIKIKKFSNTNIARAKKENYVYFPLLTEPEIALHGIANDFFFQLSAINIISRDLPSNYRLIVKEHLLSVGRRPDQFYDQIKSLKNVLIADPLDLGLDYIKYSKIVACITGTAAWEAAVMGIPVVSFSKNNIINKLNHVYYTSGFDKTDELILKIIKKNYPNKKSINDGSLLYKTYMENAINMKNVNEFISWEKSNMDNSKKDVIKIILKSFFKKY